MSVTHFGSGQPALALHCMLGHSGAWAGVAAALPGVALAAPDLPGHGRAPEFAGGDYLAACLEAIALPEAPVDLIGHSFGAVVALALAQAAPERVRTLTLIEPVLFAAAAGSAELAALDRAQAGLPEAFARQDWARATEIFLGVWGGAPGDARQRAYAEARIPLIAATHATLTQDSAGLLAPDALERLEMPVLLICGLDSPPVVQVIAEALAERMPDVGVAQIPGAGHMAPLTHPAQVAGLIAVNLERAED